MKGLPGSALLIACAWTAPSALAQTQVSGEQSGAWTLAESPVLLVGDVHVPPSQSLVIEAGVEVIGMGHYKIAVGDQAVLVASGTADQPILFTANLPVVGWRGLRFEGSSSESSLRHCVIEFARGYDIFPDAQGGAIWIQSCSPTISDCEIRFNTAHEEDPTGGGGAIWAESSSAVIRDNYIHHNRAGSGGGIRTGKPGTALIVGNRVTDNFATDSGGGMYLGQDSSPLVRDNVLLRNHAGEVSGSGGGLASWRSHFDGGVSAEVHNNLIAFNTATSEGGGVYCRHDRGRFTNNTIAFNSADQGGGVYAINYPSLSPEFSNCIVWANAASVGAQIQLGPGTGSVVRTSFSDIQGWWPGPGNINADPLFVSGPDGDFYLSQVAAGQPADSPCLDSGDLNSSIVVGTTRIDGLQDGGRLDMGYHHPIPIVPGPAYCFGDTTGAECPCFGFGAPGTGCATSSGLGAKLEGSGAAGSASDLIALHASGAPANGFGLLFHGTTSIAVPLGDGILCTDVTQRYAVHALDAAGTTSYAGLGAYAAMGDTLRYQFWFRDLQNPCGGGFNFTNGYAIAW